jgi:hypothetical protein
MAPSNNPAVVAAQKKQEPEKPSNAKVELYY